MKKFIILTLFFGISLAAEGANSAKTTTPPPPPPPKAAKKPSPSTPVPINYHSDNRVFTQVRSRILSDPNLNKYAGNITVIVQNGNVIILGNVPKDAKAHVGSVVQGVNGVKTVSNKLETD